MTEITIVTSNPGKVRELEAMAKGRLDFVMHDLEIDEIQSLDLEKIVKHKAREAYKKLKRPVVVDDVSAGLESMNGLPGPFIKYFNERLGSGSLYKLSNKAKDKVTVTCTAAYYDGKKYILGKGTVTGKVIEQKGNNGFGFDTVFVVDGETRTFAQMSEEEKMTLSHRGKAFRSLIKKLEKLN